MDSGATTPTRSVSADNFRQEIGRSPVRLIYNHADSHPDTLGLKVLRELREELGEYFFDTLFSDIDSLLLFPEKHGLVFGDHRLLSKRFPYAVYYKIEQDIVIVYRGLDQCQHPNKTKSALTNPD